jgi:hypothetical protein
MIAGRVCGGADGSLPHVAAVDARHWRQAHLEPEAGYGWSRGRTRLRWRLLHQDRRGGSAVAGGARPPNRPRLVLEPLARREPAQCQRARTIRVGGVRGGRLHLDRREGTGRCRRGGCRQRPNRAVGSTDRWEGRCARSCSWRRRSRRRVRKPWAARTGLPRRGIARPLSTGSWRSPPASCVRQSWREPRSSSENACGWRAIRACFGSGWLLGRIRTSETSGGSSLSLPRPTSSDPRRALGCLEKR